MNKTGPGMTACIISGVAFAWAIIVGAADMQAGRDNFRGFPVDLMGDAPGHVTVTTDTPRQAGASVAVLTLHGVYDADIYDEGELIINGHVIPLFGEQRGGAREETDITLRTPASWWKDGVNTLVFRHKRSAGFRVPTASVTFETAGLTLSSTGHHVPAHFPNQADQWNTRCDVGWPPYPGQPQSVVYDEVSGKWHAMGHVWNTKNPDKPNYGIIEQQYVFVSPDGLSNWTSVRNNPVIKYDRQFQSRDYDYYVNSPAYARNPDGTLARYQGKWVVAVVNFDGKDSHIQTLLSSDGVTWDERTTLWSGSETKTPPGSSDPGEQWVNSFIHNPDDDKWYLFYHGGGNKHKSSEPGTRTIGLAIGDNPKSLLPWAGEFRDGKYITQGPNVLRDAGGWLMVYAHGSRDYDGLWLARSSDLKHWSSSGVFIGGDVSISDLVAQIQGDTVEWRIYGWQDGRECVFTATVPRVK